MKTLMWSGIGRGLGGSLFVLLTIFASGCSELTATVSGSIQLDGKPLKIGERQRGMVVFRPVAGGATCTGLVSSEGEYQIATGSASALAPGDYLVSVRVIELGAPSIEGGPPSGVPITPAVYSDPLTSGLSTLVGSGANRYDIKLDSNAGPAMLTPAPLEEEESETADEVVEEIVEEELPADELPATQDGSDDDN